MTGGRVVQYICNVLGMAFAVPVRFLPLPSRWRRQERRSKADRRFKQGPRLETGPLFIFKGIPAKTGSHSFSPAVLQSNAAGISLKIKVCHREPYRGEIPISPESLAITIFRILEASLLKNRSSSILILFPVSRQVL